MEYTILSSSSPSDLTRKVNEHIKDGWKPVGGHSVVEILRQNVFSGMEHKRTIIESEYSQTMIKE